MKAFLISFLFLLTSCSSPVKAGDTPRTEPVQPTSAASSPESAPVVSQPAREVVWFFAVGDVLPHIPVKESAERNNVLGPDGKSQNHDGYDTFFERAAFLFTKADINFANLEAPVAPENEILTRSLIFNAPVALVKSLQHHGFQVVSFANNHVYDQERPGFIESLDHFEKEGMLAAGAGRTEEEAWSPRVIEKGGMQICVMALARLVNRDRQPKSAKEPQIALVPYGKDSKAAKKKALAKVAQARESCDFLLVSAHWGKEYTITPAEDDVRFAHDLLEAGADGILGHHPHVLQPLKRHTTKDGRETFIAFSMGNFVSHQDRIYPQKTKPPRTATTRDSMVLAFGIEKRAEGEEGPRGKLVSLGFYPAYTDREATPHEAGQKTQEIIRGVILDQEIAEAEAALQELSLKTSLSKEEEAVKKAWQARRDFFTERRQEIARIVGEDFVLSLSGDPLLAGP